MLYPPLFLVSPLIITLFAGFSKTNAVMINLVFYLIMLISTYLIGKKISGNKYTGLLSAFILSMFPMIFGISRCFMLDFALTAMVVFSICCLIYTDRFSNRKISLLFGISLALAFFTKWTAPVFIIGPLICVIFDPCPNLRIKSNGRIKNIVYALLIPSFLYGAWCIYNFYRLLPVSNLIETLKRGNIGTHQGQLSWDTISGLLFYSRAFYYQVFMAFFLIFILCLPFFLKAKIKYKNLIFSWFLIPYMVFTFIDSKWARYIMPALPVLAFVIAMGIQGIINKKLKLFLTCFIIIWGIFQYLVISYVPAERPPSFILRIIYTDKDRYHSFSDITLGFDGSSYMRETETVKKIGQQVALYCNKKKSEEFNVGVIWPAKINPFKYFFRVNNFNNISMYAFYEEPEKFLHRINSLDVILLKTPTDSWSWPTKEDMEREFSKYNFQKQFKLNEKKYTVFENNLKRLSDEFERIGLIKLQPDSNVYILTRKEVKSSQEIVNGDLKLFFDQGRGRIFWKGKELTEGDGIHSSFCVKGIHYDSRSAIWKAEKVNPFELSVTLRWPGLPMRQIWKMAIVDGVLNWQADLITEENMVINNLCAGIIVRDGYKKWESFYESGLLPRISFGQANAEVGLKYPIHFIGLNMVQAKEGLLPSIAINLHESVFLNRISLQSQKDYIANYVSSSLSILSREKQASFTKGNFSLFSVRISFFEDEHNFNSYINKVKSSQEIVNGDLKLFFDQGRGRIFWKGKELTEGDGVCLLLLSSNKWYSSLSQALWSIEKGNTNKLIIEGKWIDLPISHNIELEIEDNNTIVCRIDIETYADTELKQESFVVMLSDAYKDYIIPDCKQQFRFSVYHEDSYEWKDVWRAKIKDAPWAGIVDNSGHAEVTLNSSIMPTDANFIISNTNKRHLARALIYNRTNANGLRLPIGKQYFYYGKIRINNIYEQKLLLNN